jgi:hypothetical protein
VRRDYNSSLSLISFSLMLACPSCGEEIAFYRTRLSIYFSLESSKDETLGFSNGSAKGFGRSRTLFNQMHDQNERPAHIY